MQIQTAVSPLRLLVHIAALFLLTACATDSILPTRAAIAALPPSPLPSAEVPPTFTPEPGATIDPKLNFNAVNPLRPTLTPSVTPVLPSSTPRPTDTPTPTITPTPSPIPTAGNNATARYQPLFNQVTGSKLSLHVIRPNSAEIMEFVRRVQPSVIKLVDDFGLSEEIMLSSPRTLIVGRVDDREQNYVGTPEEAAFKYVQRHLPKYLANPAVDYWEGWNEPDPGMENMAWYARFEQERVRLMAQYGLRSAIGGFATGVPEVNEFALFMPAIETAVQYGAVLTLHEYGAPVINQGYGSALPGYPFHPDRGSLALRYRWYYEELLKPAGLVIPLIITEAGIDGIIGNRPGPPGYGWADFQEYAVDAGWGSNGIEAFVNQMAWYDEEVRKDYYVLGFTIFTAGPIGHWNNYDITSVLPHLTNYAASQ